MHGKTSFIKHDNKTIYKNVSQILRRLVIIHSSLKRISSTSLEITAETNDGIIMGVRHKDFPIEGIQFHPESILTIEGKTIIKKLVDVMIKIF